jgi:hypothetical protein
MKAPPVSGGCSASSPSPRNTARPDAMNQVAADHDRLRSRHRRIFPGIPVSVADERGKKLLVRDRVVRRPMEIRNMEDRKRLHRAMCLPLSHETVNCSVLHIVRHSYIAELANLRVK